MNSEKLGVKRKAHPGQAGSSHLEENSYVYFHSFTPSALPTFPNLALCGKLKTAFVLAKEAACLQIPVLIEAERKKCGLDDLLNLADYIVCSAKFPQAWTMASSVPSTLVPILLRLPNAKFVIVTLGENRCMMLERAVNGESLTSLLNEHRYVIFWLMKKIQAQKTWT